MIQQIAGGDGFPTPEKLAIYGAEGARPYGNEKLGFHKIIKRFFIAHADGNAIQCICFFMNPKETGKLPKQYQATFWGGNVYSHSRRGGVLRLQESDRAKSLSVNIGNPAGYSDRVGMKFVGLRFHLHFLRWPSRP